MNVDEIAQIERVRSELNVRALLLMMFECYLVLYPDLLALLL